MEIDIFQIIHIIRKRWKIIAAVSIVLMLGAFVFSKATGKTTYTSTSMMYIVTPGSSVMSATEVEVNSKLVTTYIQVLTSTSVLDEVTKNVGQGYTTDNIRAMISASQLSDTAFFTVRVTASNADDAQAVAEEIAKVGAPAIEDIAKAGKVEVTDPPRGAVPNYPSHGKMALIGLIAGFVLSAFIAVLIEILDTRIKNEADIAALTDIPVVGVIPEIAG